MMSDQIKSTALTIDEYCAAEGWDCDDVSTAFYTFYVHAFENGTDLFSDTEEEEDDVLP
ncbi:MAG: hypothetical protein Q9M22_07695 [Mariprofundaceae bacterium]|nr:hypothetical protein [Mariprofundaceae bacterium]